MGGVNLCYIFFAEDFQERVGGSYLVVLVDNRRTEREGNRTVLTRSPAPTVGFQQELMLR